MIYWKKKKFIERTKGKVMRTATVATVVTSRKVSLKAMMKKVIASLTKKESFNKSPRNHVVIVKIGIRP